MNEFDKLELSTETLRELTGAELEQVAGGAKPVSEVNCRPFTDTCGVLSLFCWTSGGPLCDTTTA
jgi:hypothetical protein